LSHKRPDKTVVMTCHPRPAGGAVVVIEVGEASATDNVTVGAHANGSLAGDFKADWTLKFLHSDGQQVDVVSVCHFILTWVGVIFKRCIVSFS